MPGLAGLWGDFRGLARHLVWAGWASAYVCVFGLVSLYHCIDMCQCILVSLYGPPAYLAGVRVNVSVTVSVYYGYCVWQSGRDMAENVNALGDY